MDSFKDLLKSNRIDPNGVILARHAPYEPSLRVVFSNIVRRRPDLLDMYQRYQTPELEKAMTKRGITHLAAFTADGPKRARFAGLFRIAGWEPHTYNQFWSRPENIELKSLGMEGFSEEKAKRRNAILDFILLPVQPATNHYQHRLVVAWSSERAWYQYGKRPDGFPIVEGGPAGVLPLLNQTEGSKLLALRPSRGVKAVFGPRTGIYGDGPTLLYLLRFAGDAAALGVLNAGQGILFKIGITNDIARRLSEINAGFPPSCKFRWEVVPDPSCFGAREPAEMAEQAFKDQATANGLASLGGEFFLGDQKAAVGLHQQLGASGGSSS
jgi:hypothetical protein